MKVDPGCHGYLLLSWSQMVAVETANPHSERVDGEVSPVTWLWVEGGTQDNSDMPPTCALEVTWPHLAPLCSAPHLPFRSCLSWRLHLFCVVITMTKHQG